MGELPDLSSGGAEIAGRAGILGFMTEVDTPTPTPTPTPTQQGQSGGQSHPLQIGDIVGGKYKLLSLIGKGGMGSVYRVEHMFLRSDFAMKTMDAAELSEVAVRRFQQEAKAAAALSHPNIVQVHDFGLVDEQQPFYVMDLVEGQSLHSYLQSRGALPVELAKQVFVQICFGLAAAHDQGVVHRDIKPANIIWRNTSSVPHEGDVRLIDFGIAKVLDSETHTLTATGQIIGSPSYMSPEQCMGLAVDRRSDIYSLGCVLYEMLVGVPPFVADTALSTMMRHQTEPAPTLKQGALGKGFPDEFERVVEKMLRKEPSTRYQDVQSILFDLSTKDPTSIVSVTRAKIQKELKRSDGLSMHISTFVAILVLNSLFSGLLGLLCFHFLAPSPAPKAKEDVTTSDNTFFLSANLPIREGYAAGTSVLRPQTEHSSLPYADWDTGDKRVKFVLHFGPSPSWGKVTIGRNSVPATGDVLVPYGKLVGLEVKDSNQDDKVFDRFKGTEFNNIILENYGQFTIATLQSMSRLKSLTAVEIANNNFDDRAMEYLSKLPRLRLLDVRCTSISASAICSFPILSQLETLGFGPCADASSVLQKLTTCPKLVYLLVTGDEEQPERCLTDDDLDIIARIPNLDDLSLSHQPKLTARGLAKLANSRITALHLDQMKIDREDFGEFRALKNLKRFSLRGLNCNQVDETILRLKMPWLGENCNVSTMSHMHLEDKDKYTDDILKVTGDSIP